MLRLRSGLGSIMDVSFPVWNVIFLGHLRYHLRRRILIFCLRVSFPVLRPLAFCKWSNSVWGDKKWVKRFLIIPSEILIAIVWTPAKPESSLYRSILSCEIKGGIVRNGGKPVAKFSGNCVSIGQQICYHLTPFLTVITGRELSFLVMKLHIWHLSFSV